MLSILSFQDQLLVEVDHRGCACRHRFAAVSHNCSIFTLHTYTTHTPYFICLFFIYLFCKFKLAVVSRSLISHSVGLNLQVFAGAIEPSNTIELPSHRTHLWVVSTVHPGRTLLGSFNGSPRPCSITESQNSPQLTNEIEICTKKATLRTSYCLESY